MARQTFEILDQAGHKVGEQEIEDNFAPAVLQGQTSRLIAVDGVPVLKEAPEQREFVVLEELTVEPEAHQE
jgi:hypothetical protein